YNDWPAAQSQRNNPRPENDPHSEPPAHQEAGTEAGFRDADDLEAARRVEAFRVRVANNVDGRRSAPVRGRCAMLDERATKSPASGIRLDKQRIQFRVPVLTRKYRREAFDGARGLEDEDVSGVDLPGRQIDGIRVREERVAITGIAE